MFCKFCGSELNEHAAVCTHCGCAVDNQKIKPNILTGEKTSSVFNVFNYITLTLFCLSLCFLLISIICSDLFSVVYELDYYYVPLIHTFFYLDTRFFIPSFVFGMLTYIFATINFIFSFKQENKPKRFLSDMLFIIANCLVPVMIVGVISSF